jgi:predicted nucleic acid-binding Zn ribbon protein
MERAGRLLSKLRLPDASAPEVIARAAWPLAVGKVIREHSSVLMLVGTRLVIGVEDGIWQKQLYALRSQILMRIDKVAGPGIAETLEFRVVPPRRQPQREERSARPADEADGIQDPVLRRIYRVARAREIS